MGTMLDSVNKFEIGVITFVTSIFNASSSCLMLLSGYFGIKRSIKKLISLECIVLFWSFINGIFCVIQGSAFGRDAVVRMFFPTLSGGHWFVSGYIVIMLFAPYINSWIVKTEKCKFREALILGGAVFYVFPTIFYVDFTGSGGKNIIYLLILYLVGRYIRIYQMPQMFTIRIAMVCYIGLALLTFCLNMFAEKIGMRFAFSRDCSIFILLQAVLLIVIFEKVSVQSNIVNHLSGNIISVILGEQFARRIIESVMLNYNVENTWWISCILEVILVFILCMVIDRLRKFIGNRAEVCWGNKLKYFIREVQNNDRIKDPN